jgi:two-component system LytT family response regulator
LKRLRRMLEQIEGVELIGSATEPEEAVAALTADPPDICFLDIQMPRMNGFEVLEKLPTQPAIIFTTAYDQYALKAFGVNAVDYLLKPIEAARLEQAIRKVAGLRSSGQFAAPDYRALLKQLAESLRETSHEDYLERIASRLGDRLSFIDLSKVTHFYAEDKLTYAVSDGKSYAVDYTITHLGARLDPKQFVRIHRSTIVNLAWISEVTSLPGGALNIRLKDGRGTDLTVARDRTREFKMRIGY